MKAANWNTLPKDHFMETACRQFFGTDKVTLVMNTCQPGFPLLMHNHPHEQTVYIVDGECDFYVGEEVVRLTPGGLLCIPGDVPHGMQVVGDKPVLNLDVFYPIREDYLKIENDLAKG